jgi:hypothetical protein
MSDETIWEAQKNIEYIINGLASKEWIEVSVDVDQFAELREERRFREAQIADLYEQYFLPERHESDWQLLAEIVHAVINAAISSPTADFAAGAIAGGVIGNSAYDLLKQMCHYVASKFHEKVGKRAHQRAASFKQIGNDIEVLQSFFRITSKARIEEIEQTTKLPREKIYPLLKLAGMNHHRRGTPCYWELP